MLRVKRVFADLMSCCSWLTDRKHGPNKRAVSGNNGKDFKTPSRMLHNMFVALSQL